MQERRPLPEQAAWEFGAGGVEGLDDDVLGAAGEHALALEGDDGLAAGALVEHGHGADGLDVLLAGDDVAQEAGGGGPGVAVAGVVEDDADAAVGVEFGGLAPELLRRHGGLREGPVGGFTLAGEADGTVGDFLRDEAEVARRMDEFVGFAEEGVEGFAEGALFDAGVGEGGDGEGGDVEEPVAGVGVGCDGCVEEGRVFELLDESLEERDWLVR